MPRKRISEDLQEEITELAINNPSWGADHILTMLKHKKPGRDDYPGRSTVARYQQQAKRMSPKQRQPYEWLRWPESMGSPELPWEASPVVLELLSFMDYSRLGRPTKRHARWFWHITQAAPGLRFRKRFYAALSASSYEAAGQGMPPGLEMWLAYRWWQSEKLDEQYQAALNRGKRFWGRPLEELHAAIERGESEERVRQLHAAFLEKVEEARSHGEDPVDEFKSRVMACTPTFRHDLSNKYRSP